MSVSEQRKRYWQRVKKDPERYGNRKVVEQASKKRARQDPEKLAKLQDRQREHGETYRGRRRELRALAYKRAKAMVDEAKQGKSCKQCGFSDHRAFVFHHRNPDEKEFTISTFVSQCYQRANFSELLLAEIEKCDILCANCRLILHSS